MLFNTLTGYGADVTYDGLLVAPDTFRSGIEQLIRNEMQADNGRIVMKMNSLVDPAMIELLYEASNAGVQIDLIVRGICCLRPGLSGLSENIRVRSLIGRYLEHARVYHFANGKGAGASVTYLGSADVMPRNLDYRVEALVPVQAPALERQLVDALLVELEENWQAWDLDADGHWTRHASRTLTDVHTLLEHQAVARRHSHLATG